MTHIDLNLDASVEMVFAVAFFLSTAAIVAWAISEIMNGR